MSDRTRATDEAKAWFASLSRKSITTNELDEFFDWRRDPVNASAYRAIERTRARTRGRFVVQPDPGGFCVIDTWTGEPAVFARAPQVGVTEEDARDVAEVLNRRHWARDLPMPH